MNGGLPARTFESLVGACRPREEFRFVDRSRRSAFLRHGHGFGILLDSDAVRVGGDEAAIAAGRVEQPVALVANGPPNKVGDDAIRCVVGAGLLLREGESSRPSATGWTVPLASRARSMPETHTHDTAREVPDGTAEGGRKHPREGMDAGYIRRRPRGKRDGDLSEPRRSGTARKS